MTATIQPPTPPLKKMTRDPARQASRASCKPVASTEFSDCRAAISSPSGTIARVWAFASSTSATKAPPCTWRTRTPN